MRLLLVGLMTVLIAGSGHASEPTMTGGWSSSPNATYESELPPIARFAVNHLPKPHARLKHIDQVEQQVVAGMNYRMLLTLADRKRWKVVVWKKLDGTMQMISAEPSK